MTLVAGGQAYADDDRGLPPDQVIAAIKTAVAAQPGDVKDVEVEHEGGRTLVDVKIVGKDGKKTEVRVDPQRNEVVRQGK
jgi:uncharacterized membrane protein YkoI